MLRVARVSTTRATFSLVCLARQSWFGCCFFDARVLAAACDSPMRYVRGRTKAAQASVIS